MDLPLPQRAKQLVNVVGIGTDLVEIKRIQQALARYGDAFAKRILTTKEYEIYQQHKQPAQFMAGRFALKEAVVKALGCGFRQGINWHCIEILNSPQGQPMVQLKGAAAQYSRFQIQATLSHERAYALAFVLFEPNTTIDGGE